MVCSALQVYSSADVLLLDDPLSAVDAHVADHLFWQCIRGELKGRTVLLVTHQVQFLPHCDRVVVLAAGAVKACGTFEELRAAGVEEILANSSSNSSTDDDSSAPFSSLSTAVAVPVEAAPGLDRGAAAVVRLEAAAGVAAVRVEKASNRKLDQRASSIIVEEERNKGAVSSSVVLFYLRAGGMHLFQAALLMMCFTKAIEISSSFYLAYWCGQSVRADSAGQPFNVSQNIHYLNIYAALSMSNVAGILMRYVVCLMSLDV
jgi:hypothetical protein